MNCCRENLTYILKRMLTLYDEVFQFDHVASESNGIKMQIFDFNIKRFA